MRQSVCGDQQRRNMFAAFECQSQCPFSLQSSMSKRTRCDDGCFDDRPHPVKRHRSETEENVAVAELRADACGRLALFLDRLCQKYCGLLTAPNGMLGRWICCQQMFSKSSYSDPVLRVMHLQTAHESFVRELCHEGIAPESAQRVHAFFVAAVQREASRLHATKRVLSSGTCPRRVQCTRAAWGCPNDACLQLYLSPRPSSLHHHRTVRINEWHLEKLRRLYGLHTLNSGVWTGEANALFLQRVWAMLMRYRLFGDAGCQAALPERCFEMLRASLGVTHECYASPLNCYMPTYCSAYADTDKFFGSLGSFLDFAPLEGSFQCNPPFVEPVVAAMVDHIVELCAQADEANKALSFVVVLPRWYKSPAHCSISSSKFTRAQLTLPPGTHVYKHGYQHQVPHGYRTFGKHTTVFFVQTQAASLRWPVSISHLHKFAECFRSPVLALA